MPRRDVDMHPLKVAKTIFPTRLGKLFKINSGVYSLFKAHTAGIWYSIKL